MLESEADATWCKHAPKNTSLNPSIPLSLPDLALVLPDGKTLSWGQVQKKKKKIRTPPQRGFENEEGGGGGVMGQKTQTSYNVEQDQMSHHVAYQCHMLQDVRQSDWS